jgi:hypothetical protein
MPLLQKPFRRTELAKAVRTALDARDDVDEPLRREEHAKDGGDLRESLN